MPQTREVPGLLVQGRLITEKDDDDDEVQEVQEVQEEEVDKDKDEDVIVAENS